MSNHRKKCFYCKQEVLSRDIGLHFLKRHEEKLFEDKDNRKALHKEKHLKEPINLFVDVKPYYFCLADSSCIKRPELALNHFKGKTEKHREVLLKLREKYPLEGGSQSSGEQVVRREYLSEAETKILQDIMAQVVVGDTIGFGKKDKAVFAKLGIFVETEKIKEIYPHLFPEPQEQEEEEQPSEEEHYEEPPPPPEILEDEEETTLEVLDNKTIDIPPPPLPHYTPTLPKPRPDVYLPHPTRQQQFPSIKIIQTTKRPT